MTWNCTAIFVVRDDYPQVASFVHIYLATVAFAMRALRPVTNTRPVQLVGNALKPRGAEGHLQCCHTHMDNIDQLQRQKLAVKAAKDREQLAWASEQYQVIPAALSRAMHLLKECNR